MQTSLNINIYIQNICTYQKICNIWILSVKLNKCKPRKFIILIWYFKFTRFLDNEVLLYCIFRLLFLVHFIMIKFFILYLILYFMCGYIKLKMFMVNNIFDNILICTWTCKITEYTILKLYVQIYNVHVYHQVLTV